ncbi:MAG TPA: zinc ribbon domain-containing protein [Thermoleophilaceae bacterium]
MSTVVDPNTDEHTVATAEQAPPEAPAAEIFSCPNCGAPADRGQLMCLECGSRLALGYQRPPSWRLPAAVVGIVLLIAGIGVALALAAVTDNATKTTAAAPTQPAAQNAPADTPPTASQPAPAPATSTPTTTPAPSADTATGTTSTPTATPAAAPSGWPPGKSAFTVIVASMPTQADAEKKLEAAKAAGITGAAILHSDDFPTLNPGYWVVFDGQYDAVDQAQSQAAVDRGKGEFSDAYPRFVSKDPNAKP